MSNSPKARLVQKVYALLRKKYQPPERREQLPVLEQLVLAVLCDGATTARADAVFRRLKESYYDWNEVRVSAVTELQDYLTDLPDPEQKAMRIKSCLKYIFETTYTFDIDHFRKLPKKEVIKKLAKMPAASPYLIARVIRDGLGGSAMPLDSSAVRVLTRLELIDDKTPAVTLAASLERLVPRNKSVEFCHLLAELGNDTCTELEPNHAKCCLLELCPTGQRRMAEASAAAAAARRSGKRAVAAAKPRRSKSR
jgi:endonuclease III